MDCPIVKDDQLDIRRMGGLMDTPVGRSVDGLEDCMQRLLLRDATVQRRASETASNANVSLSKAYVFGLR